MSVLTETPDIGLVGVDRLEDLGRGPPDGEFGASTRFIDVVQQEARHPEVGHFDHHGVARDRLDQTVARGEIAMDELFMLEVGHSLANLGADVGEDDRAVTELGLPLAEEVPERACK